MRVCEGRLERGVVGLGWGGSRRVAVKRGGVGWGGARWAQAGCGGVGWGEVGQVLFCTRCLVRADIRHTESGRPNRTTCSPAAAQPSSKLSTAMLESDVASTLSPCLSPLCASMATHPEMISMATFVLPVPGGPWIGVRVKWVRLAVMGKTTGKLRRALGQGQSKVGTTTGDG